MPKREERKARGRNEVIAPAWMVVGLLPGWLIGFVVALIYGSPFVRMAQGAIGGFLIGAIVDFVLLRMRKRAAKLDLLKREKGRGRQK